MGHQLEKDYPAALIAYQEVLALFRTIVPESEDVAIGLNDLAQVEKEQGDLAAAERDYKEALRIARKVKDQEGVATYTGNLADLALDQEDWPKAEDRARQALELAEEVGRKEMIGWNCRIVALALARQSRPKEGLDYAQRAVEIYTLLYPDNLKYAQDALQECGG